MITWEDIRRKSEQDQEKYAPRAELAVKPTASKIQGYTVSDIRPVLITEDLILNTALVLDTVHAVFSHWARWKDPKWTDIFSLWTASTWFADANDRLLFTSHPRLFPIADKGSGKTRMMKITRAMSRNPTGIVKAPVTAPGVRDALVAGRTVFLDEIDRQTGKGMGHLDLQSLISAYEADTASLNGQGGYNEQSIFGPMMLAAKPRILTGTNGYIEDLFERSFVITPQQSREEIADLKDDFFYSTAQISRVLKIWGASSRPGEGEEPHLWPIHSVPKALDSRMREISQPLLAVADRAVDPALMDAEGGDMRWALRAREAVQEVLLGRGRNGAEILADVVARLEQIGAQL